MSEAQTQPVNETPSSPAGGCGADACDCPPGQVRDAFGKCVMPTVTFSSLIMSFNTSALFHLGELSHPETGRKELDMELAKHAIDTLALLQSKTKGNLNEDEAELLARILYDLKMRYVRLAS